MERFALLVLWFSLVAYGDRDVKTCKNDDDCRQIIQLHSHCNPLGQCGCDEGYRLDFDAQRCASKAPRCDFSMDCHVNSHCSRSGICICDDGFEEMKASNSEIRCEKKPETRTLTYDSIHCVDESDCTLHEANSHCGAEGTCVCNGGYKLNDGRFRCVRDPDGGKTFISCSSDSDCIGDDPNSHCWNRFCFCNVDYRLSIDSLSCIQWNHDALIKCQRDDQCMFHGPHTHCASSKTCLCNFGYRFSGSRPICGLNTELIVASTVCGVAFFVLCIFCIYCCNLNKKAQPPPEYSSNLSLISSHIPYTKQRCT
ncbi:Uncharacterised protein g10368 [Pycnogonum litorale]